MLFTNIKKSLVYGRKFTMVQILFTLLESYSFSQGSKDTFERYIYSDYILFGMFDSLLKITSHGAYHHKPQTKNLLASTNVGSVIK